MVKGTVVDKDQVQVHIFYRLENVIWCWWILYFDALFVLCVHRAVVDANAGKARVRQAVQDLTEQ